MCGVCIFVNYDFSEYMPSSRIAGHIVALSFWKAHFVRDPSSSGLVGSSGAGARLITQVYHFRELCTPWGSQRTS